ASSTAAPAVAGATGNATSANEARVAAYAAFEKSANEDLEKSVGATIDRSLYQALPNAGRSENATLTARLSATIRQDVEAALKGDRQLGEQVAQILSGRRLDEETRGQVVRLIGERVQQLVPGAAKRALNEWTQATFTAHRGKAARADAVPARREVQPAAQGASPAPSSPSARARAGTEPHRNASPSDARRVDYRKLSDEQILDL